MSSPGEQSAVSVDVVVLRFDRDLRRALVAVAPRPHEPYAGTLALPGVLLHRGERLTEAARRAASTKAGLPLRACGQLATFDTPHRDPRGPTLSLAMWGVTNVAGDAATWANMDDLPELAFDHARIVKDTRPVLAGKLWRDRDFTQALTGDSFPVADAVSLVASLDGESPDRGNLNRALRATHGLTRTDQVQHVYGSGRPSSIWRWEQPLSSLS